MRNNTVQPNEAEIIQPLFADNGEPNPQVAQEIDQGQAANVQGLPIQGINKVSHYDCLHLSEVVYEKDPRYCNLKDWRCLDVTPDNGNAYKGAAYINKNTKQIIIAHCGTRFHLAANIKSDFDIFLKKIPNGFNIAKEFASKISNIQQREYADYTVTHTGHSLGGVHAQLCAYIDNSNAVTFDNPGCKEIIESYSNLLGKEQQPIKQHFIEYLSAPHCINSCGSHIGKIYRVYVPHVNLEGHSISSLKFYADVGLAFLGAASFILAPKLQAVRGLGFLAGVIGLYNIKDDISFENMIKLVHPDVTHLQRLHALENIKKCFDINFGYPYLYAEMDSWPSLTDLLSAKPYQTVNSFFNALKNDIRPTPKRHRANMEIEAKIGEIKNYQHPSFFSIMEATDSTEDSAINNQLYIWKACHSYKTFFSNNEDARYKHLLNSFCANTGVDVSLITNTDCDINLNDYSYDKATEKGYHRAASKVTCGCFSAFFKSPVPKNTVLERLEAKDNNQHFSQTRK